MANDLTGQNIKDSYKRLLTVGDDGLMYNGTGSLYTPLSASHEITTELSSSHAINADTASFATNFITSGNISASGALTASGLMLSQLGTIEWLSAAGEKQIIKGTDNYINIDGDNIVNIIADSEINLQANVTASGNISASGDIYGSDFYVSGHKALDYHPSSDSILLGETPQPLNVQSPTTFSQPVTASGDISSSGEIIAASGSFEVIDGGTF
jgi:hypothetical protein